jgi:hypothetical protein
MYFTYLNLPMLPTHLEAQMLELVNTLTVVKNNNDRSNLNISASEEVINAITNTPYDAANSLGFPLADAWEHFKDLAHFDFLEVNKEINEWAREFISKDVIHASIQAMYHGTCITPHIDERRSFAYNYVISTGGDAITCFYKAKPEFDHLTAYPQTIFPVNRLKLLEEIQIAPRRWHKLDTSTIHSVKNLDPSLKRISLSLSFL